MLGSLSRRMVMPRQGVRTFAASGAMSRKLTNCLYALKISALFKRYELPVFLLYICAFYCCRAIRCVCCWRWPWRVRGCHQGCPARLQGTDSLHDIFEIFAIHLVNPLLIALPVYHRRFALRAVDLWVVPALTSGAFPPRLSYTPLTSTSTPTMTSRDTGSTSRDLSTSTWQL